jgi:hypothetical protein
VEFAGAALLIAGVLIGACAALGAFVVGVYVGRHPPPARRPLEFDPRAFRS